MSMETQFDYHSFPDRESLTAELASRIGSSLDDGVKRNGRASLAVSGGSTPIPLFNQLSTLSLPWQYVQITLVDERWVEPKGTDSNEKLVRRHLLKNRAADAAFTGMKNQAKTAGGGEKACEQLIRKLVRPFDVLILGMGNDGHTASLFPGAAELSLATAMDSGKLCTSIIPPDAPHERITLTLPAILGSRHIFLHITGQDKKEVLDQALAEGAMEEMPIRFILRQQKTPLSIYWAK